MANSDPLLQHAEPPDVKHKTRVVNFFDQRTPIVYQKKNGPCPLFAICNYLLLKGAITLEDEGEVSEKKMISVVAEYIKGMDKEHPSNRGKNISDALDLLPSLPNGMNVNFNLTKVDDFEFTRERGLFDVLNIPLYHGCIIDPQDTETATAIGNKSLEDLRLGVAKFESGVPEPPKQRVGSEDAFDGVVTSDISQSQSSSTKLTPQSEGGTVVEHADKTEESNRLATEWSLIKHFLQSNLTQITVHGVCCLHDDIKDDELCVLYSNYHFSTMYKYKGRLYILANARAFIHQTVVWTSLEVNGGEELFTSDFTLIKPETPGNDLWKKQIAEMSTYSAAQSHHDSGEIPPGGPTTDDKMSETLNEQFLSSSAGSNMQTFDALVVNAFILKKDWAALEDYLGDFVATVVKKSREEVVMMYPGLFLITRLERLLDMLSARKFEEAHSFFRSSIESLRGCQGRYAPLDLIHNIEELNGGVIRRSWAIERNCAEIIGTRVSDYIHVNLSSAIRHDDGAAEGLWQFAMRLPKPGRDKGKKYYAFRCFLCGWVTKGQHSLSHLKKHLIQESGDIKCCYKVTKDVLERLRADDVKVPSFEYLQGQFNKMRKVNMVKWADASGPGKRKRKETLGTASTEHDLPVPTPSDECTGPYKSSEGTGRTGRSLSLTSEMNPLVPTLPDPTGPGKETDPLWLMVCKLSEETTAMGSRIIESAIPNTDNLASVESLYVELEVAVVHLRQYARPQNKHPDPERLPNLVDSVNAAASAIHRCLTPDVVPNKEDRSFLMGAVKAVIMMLKEI